MHKYQGYSLLVVLATPLACLGEPIEQSTLSQGFTLGLETGGDGDGDAGDGDGNPGDGDGDGDPGICGNAKVEGNEECDDGNAVETDACVPGCLNNVCGDGYPYQGVEACDDGNSDDTDDCPSTCNAAACGDGFIHSGVEGCDDGNTQNGDGCSADCRLESCGDGTVQPGEECDDGNVSDTDACTTLCAEATCGDGFVWAGNEACDDGNSTQTDACLNSCVEATCGDGVVWAGNEECDDNNNVQTDACTNSCNEAACGDGFIQAGVEECDDSNQADDDGCSSTCTIERLYVFVSSQSSTGNMGGLAGADARCQMLADNEGLPGTYLAWLSAAQGSPSSRFTHSNSQYWLVDGTKIADNWADLTDGTLDAPINRTEAGDPMPGTGFLLCNNDGSGYLVYTNTKADGTPQNNANYSCQNWTNNAAGAYFGRGTQTDATWTLWCSSNCQYSARIYCFQQ